MSKLLKTGTHGQTVGIEIAPATVARPHVMPLRLPETSRAPVLQVCRARDFQEELMKLETAFTRQLVRNMTFDDRFGWIGERPSGLLLAL